MVAETIPRHKADLTWVLCSTVRCRRVSGVWCGGWRAILSEVAMCDTLRDGWEYIWEAVIQFKHSQFYSKSKIGGSSSLQTQPFPPESTLNPSGG
ncbi:hypothetical protein Pelo_11200 [Pelomyxa schiedti]|nr:hypothetical protein Pelo_11200 [Pelomyxa schiedti]